MKFEYLIVELDDEGNYYPKKSDGREARLRARNREKLPINDLGAHGWELVTVLSDGAFTPVGYFKKAYRSEP